MTTLSQASRTPLTTPWGCGPPSPPTALSSPTVRLERCTCSTSRGGFVMYLGAIAESFPCHVQRVWNSLDGWYGMETVLTVFARQISHVTKAFVDSCVVTLLIPTNHFSQDRDQMFRLLDTVCNTPVRATVYWANLEKYLVSWCMSTTPDVYQSTLRSQPWWLHQGRSGPQPGGEHHKGALPQRQRKLPSCCLVSWFV